VAQGEWNPDSDQGISDKAIGERVADASPKLGARRLWLSRRANQLKSLALRRSVSDDLIGQEMIESAKLMIESAKLLIEEATAIASQCVCHLMWIVEKASAEICQR
jgi:hypothetical protein